MKIGRNAPCPCGSGKKYKKCCLGKEKHNLASKSVIRPIEERFRFLRNKVNELDPLISSYQFEDVVKAVFCICAWRDNRSAMESCLALNESLTNHDMSGKNKIKNYEDFKAFYHKIKEFLDIGEFDDITLNDFGEVKIKYDSETYSVILGTGHESVFSLLQFLPNLAKITNKESLFNSALRYSSELIDYLAPFNDSRYSENGKYFDLPNKSFYKKTCEYINNYTMPELENELVALLGHEGNPIDNRHFIYKGNLYPLFNPSMVVDCYCMMLNKLTLEHKIKHVNAVINQTLHNNFNQFRTGNNTNAVYPCIIYDNGIHSLHPYTFGFHTENSFVLAINKDEYNDAELALEIKKLRKLHAEDNLVIGELLNPQKKNKAIATQVSKENALDLVIYDSYTNVSEDRLILPVKEENYAYFSALDIVFILNFIEGLDEFGEYIEFSKKHNYSINIMGGESNMFQTWKCHQKKIVKGAIEPDMLYIDYGGADIYVYDEFLKLRKEYPYYINNSIFDHPFSWELHEKENGFLGFSLKSKEKIIGFGRKFGNNGYLFFSHNFNLYKSYQMDQQVYEIITFINDLNHRQFYRYINMFDEVPALKGMLVEYHYIPMNYAESHIPSLLNKSNVKYVYTQVDNKTSIVIKYSIDVEKLLSDMKEVSDKSIETAYFLEMIRPLEKHLGEKYEQIESTVNADSGLKKETDITTIEIQYYYSAKSMYSWVKDMSLINVRKRIAEICYGLGINSDEYSLKNGRDVIRTMQEALIIDFEDEIKRYNKYDLHIRILDQLAFYKHDINMHRARYKSFKDIDPEILYEVKEKTFKNREASKRNERSLQYLIESNLSCDRISDKICPDDILDYLIAYSDWLVVLQENSDLCHHGYEVVTVEITHEYLVNIKYPEGLEKSIHELSKRKFDNVDFSIKEDAIDKEYLKETLDSFNMDTGINFTDLYSVLLYLYSDFRNSSDIKELRPNVFNINKKVLIKDIVKCDSKIIEDVANKVINYLTIDSTQLKMIYGAESPVLPIWEREKRSDRFDVKPLIEFAEDIVFSPVILYDLQMRWQHGFLDFYPPYELGIPKTMKSLETWKKHYEDLMVADVATILEDKGIKKVYYDKELYKLDRGGNHPKDIGDYDVLAFDDTKNIIWYCECKVLRKIGSIYENRMQQKSFFEQHKEDEKFQRRINYLNKHYPSLLKAVGLSTDADYEIKSVMVVNKVFTSEFKDIDFKILSYAEFNKVVSEYY